MLRSFVFYPLSANPAKWSNMHTQTIPGIVWVCLTILWDWHLKGEDPDKHLYWDVFAKLDDNYFVRKTPP